MDTTFDFIKNKGGLTTEANYPYRAEDGNCDVSVTDKASMLDEAIEYLKQLQLQVQDRQHMMKQEYLELSNTSTDLIMLYNSGKLLVRHSEASLFFAAAATTSSLKRFYIFPGESTMPSYLSLISSR
ncbi:hypothetical protein POM88_014474 [Heracleum sosnowskyi]|uniref:Peptidase C1A papain C-terminal domain-containing protein n=1 Tax=Heracleum sosnowskyi TaxID=360622 RepID=A0AAD8N5E3_9APIA|nr:hypothetical protein POM88_014474 [Heracleum sosnowskyi]